MTPIQDRVCDSCLDFVLTFAGDSGYELSADTTDVMARDYGADMEDHLCDMVENPAGWRCLCGCRELPGAFVAGG